MNDESSKKYNKILSLLCIGLVFSLLFSLFVGRYEIKLTDFFGLLTGNISESSKNVLLNIRVPRAIVALLSGGALGLSGSIFQKAFRNPLASPDIIGISSGASLGGAISIVFISTSLATTQILSFIFGILSLFLVILIANSNRDNKIFSLVVSGVIINSLSSAFLMFIKYTADPEQKLPAVEYFLMGGLYNTRRHHIVYLGVIIVFCLVILQKFKWRFTVLSLDDDEILALGINPSKTRFFMLSLASLLVSTAVSICGVIGFIGLIAPYIARLLTEKLNKGNMRLSFIIGAIILSISDMIARTISSSEIPVGIIISIISTPILIFMLTKSGASENV